MSWGWRALRHPRAWLLRNRSFAAHAAQPLVIETPDGSGQATHPDIVFFERPWRGHHYWMVITPYPFLDESVENPCLYVSADGLDWSPPPGVVNPLDETPAQGFHADPDMIHVPGVDQLWIYYLNTVRGERQWVKRIVSDDGVNWSRPEAVLEVPYQQMRSPAFVCREGRFFMWSINLTGAAWMERRESSDGVNWSAPARVKIDQPGCKLSHLDVAFEPWRGRYLMVLQALPRAGGPQALFWCESVDGLEWKTRHQPLLSPGDAPEWARQTLYRTTFRLDAEGGLRLWYCGRSMENENRMAFTRLSPEKSGVLFKHY